MRKQLEGILKKELLKAFRKVLPEVERDIKESPFSRANIVIRQNYYFGMIKYDKNNLKEHPNPSGVITALGMIYELITGKKNHMQKKALVQINTNKEQINLFYKKDEPESEEVIKEFIKLLKEYK